MIGRRQIRPPTQADTNFVLVEFTEDGEFEIYTEDKVKKTSLGLFLAPYGPHKVDYPCRIIQLSSNKAELIKLKNEYVEFEKNRQEYLSSVKDDEFTNNESNRDNGHNEGEGDNSDLTSDGEIEEIQKTKKNLQEHTEGKKEKGEIPVQNKDKQLRMEEQKQKKKEDRQRKQEEQQKKKEGKQNKKQEMLRMEEEKKKKKEEQQRKKEERQLKKKEQEQKKEEKQKRKEEQEKTKALLLQRNQSIMQQMADFEEPDICDLDSTTQQEPQYDNFTTDVVDESVSLISSCQQVMQLGEVPLVQNVQRPQVNQNPNKKLHPTTGKKYPRKQFMPKTASRKLSEGPDAKRLTTPTSATYTGSYSQVPIACSSNSQLPKVCNNCTVLLKELEDARYQIQSLKQKLEEHGGDDSFDGKSTEGVTHVMTNPRAGKVSKSVADLYQMVELVPGTRIYVYQNQVDKAMTRDTATARARCIIMAFYTPEELLEAANLSGANEKRGLDPDIVDAVIGFSVKQFGDTKKNRNDIKASLRRKLSAMSSDEKKRQQDSELLEMKSAKKAKK